MTASSHDSKSPPSNLLQNVKMNIGDRLRSLLSKLCLFLERIKYVPWFSLLLILLLSWGSYQVMSRPNSKAYAWFKQSIQRVERLIYKKGLMEHSRSSKNPLKAHPQPIASDSESLEIAAVNFAQHETRLVALEGRLASMQKTIDQLQQTNDALKGDIDTITAQLEAINQAMNTELQPSSEDTVKTTLPTEALSECKERNYSVHAVIQGRAWLNTPEGKIITVNVGSQLPRFGIVEQIDTDNRLVYFDQGSVIGPSMNES